MPVNGFKEWNVVCDAIGSGRQDLIFRKGGIHEGREGFSFKHDSFFLFPTLFHSQGDHVTEGEVPRSPAWQEGDKVMIKYFCKAVEAVTLKDWDEVSKLEGRHILTEKTIRDRFDWEGKGMVTGSIHCAILDVYALAEPWVIKYGKQYGGCMSWVTLPDPPEKWAQTMKKV